MLGKIFELISGKTEVGRRKDMKSDRRQLAERRLADEPLPEEATDRRRWHRRLADRRGYFNNFYKSYMKLQEVGTSAAYDLKNYFERHFPTKPK